MVLNRQPQGLDEGVEFLPGGDGFGDLPKVATLGPRDEGEATGGPGG